VADRVRQPGLSKTYYARVRVRDVITTHSVRPARQVGARPLRDAWVHDAPPGVGAHGNDDLTDVLATVDTGPSGGQGATGRDQIASVPVRLLDGTHESWADTR
jgi:hypothetical protein